MWKLIKMAIWPPFPRSFKEEFKLFLCRVGLMLSITIVTAIAMAVWIGIEWLCR